MVREGRRKRGAGGGEEVGAKDENILAGTIYTVPIARAVLGTAPKASGDECIVLKTIECIVYWGYSGTGCLIRVKETRGGEGKTGEGRGVVQADRIC